MSVGEDGKVGNKNDWKLSQSFPRLVKRLAETG